MTIELYKTDILEKELEALPPFHQLAFAAACCERLLPNYYIFAREESRTDQKLLRKALDEVWQILLKKELDINTIRQLILKCDEIFSDEEDTYDGTYGNEALKAYAAIYYTLEFCLEQNNRQLLLIVSQIKNTLYEYLQWRFHEEQYPYWDEKPLSEQKEIIAAHPLSVREMVIQAEHLQRLKKQTYLDHDFLEWLRISSYNEGKSLLDLA